MTLHIPQAITPPPFRIQFGTARFFIRFSELVDLLPPRTAVNSIYQATITALPTPRHPAQSDSQHRLVEQQTGISQDISNLETVLGRKEEDLHLHGAHFYEALLIMQTMKAED
ncbi:hypothetical protein PtA15_3A36 [Puccinia triticina]|uniref:Uncharacterized protein n=1 Tax=Puccinia triticina TaxID=208348 RepID=A0ABY7CBT2_9BASI|nr:uncharacterized protein PtA15_3A36 [Puccinia triticina]WAQ82673.1 hypothetical protein PtA15_3A36 [Puccinia triticina]